MATSKKSTTWALIGIPDDRAVLNVGGRVGAARGPSEFRHAFNKLIHEKKSEETMRDFGNVSPISGDIVGNHGHAAALIERATSETDFSVVVGGSHDHAFSHLRGIWLALGKPKNISCINVDAHLDVRAIDSGVTSGSGFYLSVETGTIQPSHLVEFGIQSHCNSPTLIEYVKKKKIRCVKFPSLRHGKACGAFQSELRKLAKAKGSVVVSFCLDAVAAAYSPGVSAPQAEGFTASEAIEMAEIAGAEKNVLSFGIFELNPLHDPDHKTAILAATLAYHFVSARLRA